MKKNIYFLVILAIILPTISFWGGKLALFFIFIQFLPLIYLEEKTKNKFIFCIITCFIFFVIVSFWMYFLYLFSFFNSILIAFIFSLPYSIGFSLLKTIKPNNFKRGVLLALYIPALELIVNNLFASFTFVSLSYQLTNFKAWQPVFYFIPLPLISFLIIVINFLFFDFLKAKNKFSLIFFLTIIIIFSNSNFFIPNFKQKIPKSIGDGVVISLIQMGKELEQRDDMKRLKELLKISKLAYLNNTKKLPQIIIWGESILSSNFAYNRKQKAIVKEWLKDKKNVTLLTGIKDVVWQDGFLAFNSALLIKEGGNIVQHFDKNYPIPVIENFASPLTTEKGSSYNVFDWHGYKILLVFCNESLKQSYIRQFSKKVDFAILITGDSWSPYQAKKVAEIQKTTSYILKRPIFRTSDFGPSYYFDFYSNSYKEIPDKKSGFLNTNF